MASYITNRAKLAYKSENASLSTFSNTASITLAESITVSKYALETAYRLGESLVYDVFIVNTGDAALTALVLTDNLGTYTISEGVTATPLTYVGPAKAYIDSESIGTISAEVAADQKSVVFRILSLPSGSSLHLEYKVLTNEYAPAKVDSSSITNIISVTATEQPDPVTASHTIPIDRYTNILIEKTMTPDPYEKGTDLTYTFQIRNYGTIKATSVVLTDSFDPAPVLGEVTLNMIPLANDQYSYNAGDFRYPHEDAIGVTFNIDAAQFITDQATGLTTISPGVSVFVVKGRIPA